jgi:hypothetical protein
VEVLQSSKCPVCSFVFVLDEAEEAAQFGQNGVARMGQILAQLDVSTGSTGSTGSTIGSGCSNGVRITSISVDVCFNNQEVLVETKFYQVDAHCRYCALLY